MILNCIILKTSQQSIA